LTTQNKMLASTVQFSTNTQPTPPAATRQRQPPGITTSMDRTLNNHSHTQPVQALVVSEPQQDACPQPHQPQTHRIPHQPPPRGSRQYSPCSLPSAGSSPVSPPTEHPTTTSGRCGLLNRPHPNKGVRPGAP
jgi:hypothetical protein